MPPIQYWLNQICTLLPGVSHAVVVKTDRIEKIEAQWPVDSKAITPAMLSAIKLYQQQAGSLTSIDNQAEQLLLVRPIKIDEQDSSILCLQIHANPQQQPVIEQLLAWSEQWVELLVARHNEAETSPASVGLPQESTKALSLASLLSCMTSSLNLAESCHRLARLLTVSLKAERISIGLIRRPAGTGEAPITLVATSDNKTLDTKQPAVKAIEDVFRCLQTSKDNEDQNLQQCEQAYASARNIGSVFTTPLLQSNKQLIGAILVESKFEDSHRQQLVIEKTARLIGPLLDIKRLLPDKKSSVLPDIRHKSKIVAGVCALALGSLFMETGYRVTSKATVEGEIQRAVVAPYDGYLQKAHYRAGESVFADSIIAELDPNQLLLEKQKLQSQIDQHNKDYRQALSNMEYANSQIVRAQIAQLDAQLNLVHNQLQQGTLTAPISGIIITGDLSQSLGAPISKGEVLFEIAPAEAYRVSLFIPEENVADIQIGTQGTLALTALPNHRIPFKIDNISIAMKESEQRTYFRAEASLTAASATYQKKLRPGMEGVGKIELGNRRLGWILFHDLIDWLHLRLWTWIP
ncbi:efflux RND transporter periplasmic adaptor subunit [Maricurvus nonylphenolicus]|uniref:efflux RND transporter periplasmic adaptor subunit n=1 Tax=Maricurvus nonylphenolicus TaxID=1008307 RepID=UPI0036F276EE